MITHEPNLEHGLIETILVINGAVVELEAHLGRLERSAVRLYEHSLPAELRPALESARRTVPHDQAARLRVAVWPTPTGLGFCTEVERATRHLLTPLSGTGLRLEPASVAGGLGAHKWRDRRLIEQLGDGLGLGEELVIVDDGEILETGAGNLFAVFANRITTPPVDHRILPGVTRARVLRLAGASGFGVEERRLELTELSAATELFVTSAVRGVMPVIECGKIGWPIGGIALKLRRTLGALWASSSQVVYRTSRL
jgi:para-aminobenzoate synthetase / 4-amino-4-deoxychorismate lyase